MNGLRTWCGVVVQSDDDELTKFSSFNTLDIDIKTIKAESKTPSYGYNAFPKSDVAVSECIQFVWAEPETLYRKQGPTGHLS